MDESIIHIITHTGFLKPVWVSVFFRHFLKCAI